MKVLDSISIFERKLNQQKLANFYCIWPNSKDNDSVSTLELWKNEFIKTLLKVYKKTSTDNSLGHADILEIFPVKEKYSTNDPQFLELYKFLEFSAIEFPTKTIILHQAEILSHTILNKLLKSLEEPGNKTTIIFLYTKNINQLETVKSRAIHIHLSNENTADSLLENHKKARTEFEKFLNKSTNLNEFLNKIKTGKVSEDSLIKVVIDHFNNANSNFAQKEKFLNCVKEFYSSKIFHNSTTSRFAQLFSSIE